MTASKNALGATSGLKFTDNPIGIPHAQLSLEWHRQVISTEVPALKNRFVSNESRCRPTPP